MVHSWVERRLVRVSLALEIPPANAMVRSGGSWFMREV